MTDQDEEKRGFWGDLFRRASVARRPSTKPSPAARERDRDRDYDQGQQQAPPSRRGISSVSVSNPPADFVPVLSPKRRPVVAVPAFPNDADDGFPAARRRPRRPQSELDSTRPSTSTSQGTKKSSAASAASNGRLFRSPGPSSQWPPSGMSSQEELPPQHALELIARGAPSHKGHKRCIPHVGDDFYSTYTTSDGNRHDATDAANLHDAMTQFMTMRTTSPGRSVYPWETLEQPSFGFYFGHMPCTITLNQWAAMASLLPPAIALRDSGVMPRPMDLERIFERLQELRFGLEDDDESLLYRILYKRILRDPDKILSPHKTLDRQITDLILVLSRPDWIDFTNPRNQVATRFVFDNGGGNDEQYRSFFHQLLLSLELDMRIQSRQHGDWAKEKLLQQIPPTIQWNLALARRWQEYVRVDDFGKTPDDSE